MKRHLIKPIELDMQGDWDGVVKFDYATKQFVRYLDRNGEHKEAIEDYPCINFQTGEVICP